MISVTGLEASAAHAARGGNMDCKILEPIYCPKCDCPIGISVEYEGEERTWSLAENALAEALECARCGLKYLT